jgi:RNA 3'-terminal phosphate cyclase (ATP)
MVARDAVAAARSYLAADAAVGAHLADQLLVPLALGAGGAYVTGTPTAHFTSCVSVIWSFLAVDIDLAAESPTRTRVEVRGRDG